ncbi:MAG TPA: DUF4398 domain-containing protein [Polyangia bacterium]|jgi:hypothetical protein|nr:DUF4398 domain-containing protein [Polyangia bacterium]
MRYVFLSLGIVGALGCASSPPVAQQEQSSASIRAAEEVGATHVPQAALHLQLAKEQFAAAKAERSDKDRAGRLLARAQVDAELALALARTEAERSEAQTAVDQLNHVDLSTPQ